MNRILVFTDFSKCAELATDAAITLAAKTDSELLFVHYINNAPEDWEIGSLQYRKAHPNVYESYIQSSLAMADLELKAEQNNVQVKSELVYNFSASNLPAFVVDQGVDIIMMGSHGRNTFEEFMLGSQAQQFARISPVPVIVLKQPFDLVNSHLVFISDFEEESKRSFDRLLRFAEVIEAPVSLVYVDQGNKQEQVDKARTRMSEYGAKAKDRLETTEIIEEKILANGIEKFCTSTPNAVISMGTHGRQGLVRMVLGSQTEKVINQLAFPVMSLPI